MARPVLARLQSIDRRIRAGHYPNARSLARELEVSVRTVERDIELLRDRMGAPLEYDSRRRGYFYNRPDFALRLSPLGPAELAALQLASHLLRLVAGSAFEQPVRAFLDQVAAALPPGVTLEPEDRTGLSFGLPPLRGDEAKVAGALELLHEALLSRRTVEAVYHKAYREAWGRRRIDPYHLHYMDGAWYVVAWCHWRRRVLNFAVDRMHEVRLLAQRFTVLPGFDARSYLKSAWKIEAGDPVSVAVRFAPVQARYIRERQWHETQELEEEPGGGLVLRARVAGLAEVTRWLLQFGGGAEALAPPELRKAVRREVLAMAAVYGLAAGERGTGRAGSP